MKSLLKYRTKVCLCLGCVFVSILSGFVEMVFTRLVQGRGRDQVARVSGFFVVKYRKS